jgi:hypothetical protein
MSKLNDEVKFLEKFRKRFNDDITYLRAVADMADAELISQTAHNKIKALYKTDIRKNTSVTPVKVTSDTLKAMGKRIIVDPYCADRTIIIDDNRGITPKPIKEVIKKSDYTRSRRCGEAESSWCGSSSRSHC